MKIEQDWNIVYFGKTPKGKGEEQGQKEKEKEATEERRRRQSRFQSTMLLARRDGTQAACTRSKKMNQLRHFQVKEGTDMRTFGVQALDDVEEDKKDVNTGAVSKLTMVAASRLTSRDHDEAV